MSRWFRLDDDVINDPKILKLPEDIRWHWIALLCVASKHGGSLPSMEDVSILLRLPRAKANAIVTQLRVAGLLDETETGFAPHNWAGRQYKSDVSTERVKRFRNADKKRHETVSETADEPFQKRPQKTEAETDKDSEANASGAEAPIDHRKRLFDEGLPKLARMTGKGPDSCRSFVAKCLKAAGDDAVVVLGLIDDADRNQAVDPSAWIAARLKGTTNGPGQTGSRIIQAADDLCRKIASFDGPGSPGGVLRSGESAPAPRLLSHR